MKQYLITLIDTGNGFCKSLKNGKTSYMESSSKLFKTIGSAIEYANKEYREQFNSYDFEEGVDEFDCPRLEFDEFESVTEIGNYASPDTNDNSPIQPLPIGSGTAHQRFLTSPFARHCRAQYDIRSRTFCSETCGFFFVFSGLALIAEIKHRQ